MHSSHSNKPSIREGQNFPPQAMQRAAGFALLYFIIAWAFHAGTINPLNHLIGGGDGFIQGFPSKLFSTSFSSWNPSVQAGKYVFADVLYQSFYPPNLVILSFLPNTLGFNFYLLAHYALAGLFTYLFLHSLRLTTYSAFIGGLTFMVSGFMCAHKGHEYIICSAIWLPLVLYFVHCYVERLQILCVAWAAVPLGLSILAGFPQITLYSSALILAYLATSIFHSPKLKGWSVKFRHLAGSTFLLFFLAGLLGCLPILAVAETSPHLTRERITYEMFTSDGFPPWQVLTLLIPNFFGGVDRHIPMYGPGTTIFAAEVYPYIGLLPLAFAIGCFTVRRAIGFQARFWSAAAAVALLLSFGGMTPVYWLLFHLPIYNLFRVPARHLFEVDFALSILAALGLDYFLRHFRLASEKNPGSETTREKMREQKHPGYAQQFSDAGKRIKYWRPIRKTAFVLAFIFGSSLLLAGIIHSLAAGFLSHILPIPDSAILNYYYRLGDVRDVIAGNLSWHSPTLLLPLFIFAITMAIVLSAPRTNRNAAVLIAIPIVVSADSFLGSHRMYDNPSTDALFSRALRPELDFLQSRNFDRSHYRIFPVDFDLGSTARLTSTYHLLKTYPYPLLNMFDGLSVINDYGPFWLKRYQAVTGFGAGGTIPPAKLQNYKILSVLGTRFLLALSTETKQSIEATKAESESNGVVDAFSSVETTPNGITIYQNSRALPRFRFVKRIIAARDLDDALSLMSNRRFDPANEAVVENLESEDQLATGKIIAEQIGNTWLNLEVETEGRSFLVVADSFFPGWTAAVDGKTTTIFPAYGCVRGITIENAGIHHVTFRFIPRTLFTGLACTALGTLLLGLLGWVAFTVRSSSVAGRRSAVAPD